MSNTKDIVIAWFYKRSAGELHVGLPILKAIHDEMPGIRIYLFFETSDICNSIGAVYKGIIEDIGYPVAGTLNYFRVMAGLISRKMVIMTCYSSFTRPIIAAKRINRNNIAIVHPHAYALQGTNKVDAFIEEEKVKSLDRRYDGARPFLIVTSAIDSEYYEKIGFDRDRHILAGSLGYTEWWIRYFNTFYDTNHQYFREQVLSNHEYEKVFFCPIRGANRLYLTRDNYDYLIDSLFWLAEENPRCAFIIKPHPRQKNFEGLIIRAKDVSNIYIVNESTLYLAKNSDFTISVWSSAIQDSLAVDTPAIEFHIHEVEHPQVMYTYSGDLISNNTYYGICKHFTRKEDVSKIINSESEWDELLNTSKRNFKSLFLLDASYREEFVSEYNRIVSKIDWNPHSLVRSFILYVYYFAFNLAILFARHIRNNIFALIQMKK